MKSWRIHLSCFAGLTALKILVFLLVPRFQPFVGDNAADHYLPAAERLLTQGRFNGPDSRPDSKVPPGYPACLAVAKAISPARALTLMVCVQLAADFLVAMAIYILGAQLCSIRAGWLAGLAWLLFPPATVIATWVTAETIYTALFVTALTLLMVRPSWSFLAGLVLGMATLFRGTAVFLPVWLIPFWLLKRWQQGLLFALGVFCVVLPWTVRNYLVLDDRILVAVGSGSVFLQGSEERTLSYHGKNKEYPAMYAAAAKDGIVKPADHKESKIDNWMRQVGLRNYRLRLEERPWSFVSFFTNKFFRLWYGTESCSWKSQLAVGIWSVAIVPLGIWQLWRKRAALLLWTLGYFVLLHWVTLPQLRYMLPVYPFLILATISWLTDESK